MGSNQENSLIQKKYIMEDYILNQTDKTISKKLKAKLYRDMKNRPFQQVICSVVNQKYQQYVAISNQTQQRSDQYQYLSSHQNQIVDEIIKEQNIDLKYFSNENKQKDLFQQDNLNLQQEKINYKNNPSQQNVIFNQQTSNQKQISLQQEDIKNNQNILKQIIQIQNISQYDLLKKQDSEQAQKDSDASNQLKDYLNMVVEQDDSRQSELQKLFSQIQQYSYEEYKQCQKWEQSEHQFVDLSWEEETFNNINQFQSKNFQNYKKNIFSKLKQNSQYLSKIFISNQKEDLIVGYKKEEQTYFIKSDTEQDVQVMGVKVLDLNQKENIKIQEYVYKIMYNPIQSEVDQQIITVETIGLQIEHIQIEQENIDILIMTRDDFLKIQNQLKQLFDFKPYLSQKKMYHEINSKSCQYCNKCQQMKTCSDSKCFKNVKFRILGFLQNKNYKYCVYDDKKTQGIIFQFQLNEGEFIREYQYFVLKIIFSFIYKDYKLLQNNSKEENIHFSSATSFQKEIYDQQLKENDCEKLDILETINQYSFKEFHIKNKLNQDYGYKYQGDNFKREWDIDKFNTVNANQISDTFQKQKNDIIQILKEKNYYLCKCLAFSQKEDIFIGYQENIQGQYQNYIFIVKYNPINFEIQKYLLVKKFNEEINYFILNDAIHISILQEDTFIQIYNNFEDLNQITIEWTKEYFEEVNKNKEINFQKCKKCKECQSNQECSQNIQFKHFQRQKDIILEKLQQKNYFLCEYINKGGEGIIFQGFEQSIYGKQDLIFKILFDYDVEQIQAEIKIMELFELCIGVIQFIDHVKINEEVDVLVLEKCQFSLKDELVQFQQKQEFPFHKLLQMIFNLLDGLIQLRIYNILHLDIKPQNILLSTSGKYIYTDFGISSVKKGNQQVNVKGWTQFYASPEQKEDDININFQSDIFSLGKTFEIILQNFQDVEKNSQYKDLIEKFNQIIKQNMVQNLPSQRSNCMQLASLFFQEALKCKLCEEFLQYYMNDMKNILKLYPFDQNKEIPYFLQISLYYNKNILTFLEYSIKNIQDTTSIQNHKESIAEFLTEVAFCYQNLGDYSKALEYFLESLQIRKQIFKNNNLKIVQSLQDTGLCYLYLGDTKNALEKQLESLQIAKEFFQVNNFLIAQLLDNIGLSYKILGNYKKALDYFLKSLEIKKEIINQYNPFIAQPLNNIGICYFRLGENKKALDFLFQALEIAELIYNENHIFFSKVLNNIGICYQNLGDHQNSIPYLQQSLKILQLIFKDNHPDIAKTLNNIGSCYLLIGDYKNASQFLLESLQMAKSIFKNDHPDVAQYLNNVGSCLINLGDCKKALEYLLESLQMNKSIFSSNHPNISQSLHNVGSCFIQLSNNKKALAYQLESLQMLMQISKDNHPDLAQYLNSIGTCYQNLNDNEKALKYKLKSIQMIKQIFKENHPQTAKFINNLGVYYLELDDYQNALGYLLESLQMRKQIYKNGHIDTATSLHNVGQCYECLGNSKNALEYYQESLQMKKQIFKESHIEIVDSLQNISRCYKNLGENQKTLEYQLEKLEMEKLLFSEIHPNIVKTLNNIGFCYKNAGDNTKALKYLQESYTMGKILYKDNNPDIAQCLVNIGLCYQNIGENNKALQFQLQSLQMRKQLFKVNHLKIAESLSLVGNCYKLLGDHKNDLEHQIQAFQILQQIFDKNHPQLFSSLKKIEACYKNLSFNEKTIEYQLNQIQTKDSNDHQSK